MEIQRNIILAPYTTFKIGGPAKFFCIVKNAEELQEALKFAKDKKLEPFILGGGSNVLISDEGFDGLVAKIDFKGVKVVLENDQKVILQIASGEIWDKIVEMAVQNGWWGIENLSHIPGTMGGFAVQNVGAYGQEASQIIERVIAFDTESKNIRTFKNQECQFGYRKSVFNTGGKGRFVILEIVLKLNKKSKPNLGYKELKEKFRNTIPTLTEIREAVVEIRNKKFPFPIEGKNGNAGSFFKNPILNNEEYQTLLSKIGRDFGEEMVKKIEQKKFLENSGQIKIPAAFLIDLCGLKSLEFKGAAINYIQPLVIVNKTGKATAKEVFELAKSVRKTVFDQTGIKLTFEPELVGFSKAE